MSIHEQYLGSLENSTCRHGGQDSNESMSCVPNFNQSKETVYQIKVKNNPVVLNNSKMVEIFCSTTDSRNQVKSDRISLHEHDDTLKNNSQGNNNILVTQAYGPSTYK